METKKRPETTKKKIGENQIEGIIYKKKPYNYILPPPPPALYVFLVVF
jgi:hypothetical protein